MFVIAGEALMDLVLEADGKQISAHVGGGPLNCAIALSRLEKQVGFLHPISTDYYGRRLMRYLQDNHVDYLCPYRSEESTPLAMTHVNQQGEAEYRFYRHQTAERDLRLNALLDRLPANPAMIHTGTLAIAENPDAEIIKALLLEARERGAMISVDPNIRARNFKDHTLYRTVVMEVMALANLIKVSEDDLYFLFPEHQNHQKAAFSALCDAFPQAALIVMTAGASPVLYRYFDQIGKQAPEKLNADQIIDTIGAGDCFAAGLLHQCAHHNLLKPDFYQQNRDHIGNYIRWASRVAGLNCLKAGCDPPVLAEVGDTF